jgi:GntR family transcriptional regulator
VADDLDPDSIDPLFEQLAAILREQIERGEITGRMPSETTLSQQYGISRGTARKAAGILISEGWARVSRGRGTFVVRPEDRK